MAPNALIRALAAGAFLLAPVYAQDAIAEIDLWSTSDCGGDPNDLSVLSITLDSYHRNGDLNNPSSGCTSSWINLDGWPTLDNGKYAAWVDSSGIEDGCVLWFYHLFGSNEQLNDDSACLYPYRKIDPATASCASLELTKRFGYGYCCGGACTQDVSSWKRTNNLLSGSSLTSKPRDQAHNGPTARNASPRDVVEVKRAPLLERVYGRDDSCKFVLDEKSYTTYGKAEQISEEVPCPIDQTTCGKTYTYSKGYEVTNGFNVEVSVSAEFFGVVSTSVSSGYEHSETNSESFSSTTMIAPQNGHSGYIIFIPLYVCGKGHAEGNCDSSDTSAIGDDGTVCVLKLLEGNQIDGIWDVVTVT
ncbi:hypothetical protein GGR58DRAFT_522642 [Xylaria digitata]|nr:hypothetical protein GGR58DRAFT_522642 [Xylaria digitata]